MTPSAHNPADDAAWTVGGIATSMAVLRGRIVEALYRTYMTRQHAEFAADAVLAILATGDQPCAGCGLDENRHCDGFTLYPTPAEAASTPSSERDGPDVAASTVALSPLPTLTDYWRDRWHAAVEQRDALRSQWIKRGDTLVDVISDTFDLRAEVASLTGRAEKAEGRVAAGLALCASFDPTSGSSRARTFKADLRAALSGDQEAGG